jgi:hypothetical protein
MFPVVIGCCKAESQSKKVIFTGWPTNGARLQQHSEIELCSLRRWAFIVGKLTSLKRLCGLSTPTFEVAEAWCSWGETRALARAARPCSRRSGCERDQ